MLTYFQGLIIATDNFAFEMNVTLGLESNLTDEYAPKQCEMGPLINRVKIQIYFYSLTFEINNFAFEFMVKLDLKSTFPDEQGPKQG